MLIYVLLKKKNFEKWCVVSLGWNGSSGKQNIFFLRRNLIKGDHDHYSDLPRPYNTSYHQDFLLHQIHQLWSSGGIITESCTYTFKTYISSLMSYYQLSPNRFRVCLIFVKMAGKVKYCCLVKEIFPMATTHDRLFFFFLCSPVEIFTKYNCLQVF